MDVAAESGRTALSVDSALLDMMKTVSVQDRAFRIIRTPLTTFHVIVEGDVRKPALVTLHDVGLNSATTFDAFFCHPANEVLRSVFCFYHINAPGQHAYCPEVTPVPEMKDMIESMEHVLNGLGIERCVGFGYGAGGYILTGFASLRPERVVTLVLINVVTEGSGWGDYAKFNTASIQLHCSGFSENVTRSMSEYYCGGFRAPNHEKLVEALCGKFKQQNPVNLANFLSSFVRRETLLVDLRNPVLFIFGAESPHADQTKYNFDLMSTTCFRTQMAKVLEIPHCRLPLDESPQQVAHEILSFFKSLGLFQ